ncbi:MAG: hypothetical protein ACXV8U_22440 [Methylobacter sp.]
MDWWIMKQLRAMVLTDLRDFVPQGYFESEVEKFKFDNRIKNSDHFSRELRWGYLAGKLGKMLFFESSVMSARQVSASEVLMNLGMLAGAEAAQGAAKQLSKDAKIMGVSDGNAGAVAEQLGRQHIPTLSNNIVEALEQYLHYLKPLEAKPFLTLVIARKYPINLDRFSNRVLTFKELKAVVNEILNQFQDLMENKGLWKELWDDNGKSRKEMAAQRLFFAVAYSYCKANNIDLTPEANAGNGPVDFKLSQGFDSKIVVEVKLSTNDKLVHGYEKQLEIYKRADDTDEGVFLLVDVGRIGNKYAEVQRVRREFLEDHGKASEIWYVDGTQKTSASKRV